MKAIIQRVSQASVTIHGAVKSNIGIGFLVLLGIEHNDTIEDMQWLVQKIANIRIFNDEQGLMNLDIHAVHGDIIVVSQFTLHASTKKGNRPSFIKAARPDIAVPLYEAFVAQLQQSIQGTVLTGEFGADMKVNLCNDGPVTIIIDTKQKE
ncbi:MAG: D-tyrosyl-tRNA(Tyr) deacylase [Bacteroidetes bacterium ADurb.Bin217]|nr:MAG: D-tyrosyl-tRNA(Tyr) deacylase [Bacteroidetes bacterium ADurb.Bin217]HOS85422.1 D-aminoacyl-tRNA deacylase [Bacteroidales bacterium]